MSDSTASSALYAHLLPLPPDTSPRGTEAPGSCRLTPLGGGTAFQLTIGDLQVLRARFGAQGGRLLQVEEVGGLEHGNDEVAALVEFDGPRSAEQVAADRFATHERVAPAAGSVPGTGGALCLRGEDGSLVVVALAQSVQALEDASRAILSTPLLPGEDPALLGGPDRWTPCRVDGADALRSSLADTLSGRSA